MSTRLFPSPTTRQAAARRPALLAAAMLAVCLASGCAAGFDAESQSVRPNSGAGKAGSMVINNVWVVVDPITGNAEVIGSVANTGTLTDRLTSVQAGGDTATVHAASPAAVAAAPFQFRGVSAANNAVVIGSQASVSFGRLAGPELEITGGSFQPGRVVPVTFDFATAGPATMNAQIMPNTGLFAEYNPNAANPVPTPFLPPAPTAKPTGTATATPTATGTATATATATPTPTAATPTETATPTPSASPTHTA
jgi:hypothetical protein